MKCVDIDLNCSDNLAINLCADEESSNKSRKNAIASYTTHQ